MASEPPPLSDLLQHGEFLERIARQLARDPSEAADIVQETWLAAIERPPRHGGNLRSWLSEVARNALRQRRRSEKRPQTSGPPAPIEPLEDALDRATLASLLAKELCALPEPYRGVLIHRYYEGMTPAEIAELLGRPVSTVTSQIGRGLRRLQERLARPRPLERSL